MRLLGLASGVVCALGPAAAQPAAPTIAYPNATQNVNIKRNPTIFWSVYDRGGTGFENDVQKSFQIQIATAGTFAAGEIVYATDSGPGDPPDCRASVRPRCLGAGMAHYVGADGAYPGLFLNGLAGAEGLAEGTAYFVRVRVQSRQDEAWSPWSPTVGFTTVAYDGRELFVAPGGRDSGACTGTGAAACATLGGALGKVAPGDKITIAPGTYLIPESTSGSPGAINFFDAPDRIWIRGASRTDRPLFKPSINKDMSGSTPWIRFTDGDDVLFENIVFQGADGCCTTFKGGNNAPTFLFGLSASANPVSDRVSFVRVDFLKNVFVVVDDNPDVPAPAVDILFKEVTRTNEPFPTTLQSGQNRTLSGINVVNTDFLTLKQVTLDGGETGIFTTNQTTPTNPTDYVLLEETRVHRYVVHPLRPEGLNRNWTVRRHVQGAGPEGFHFGGVTSSIQNLVVENSSFVRPMQICDNGGNGSIGYLVATNNSFANPLATGSPRGMFHVDEPLLRPCDSGSSCVAGRNCDVVGPGDRIFLGFNNYYKLSDSAIVAVFDGTDFTRCTGASDYDAWNSQSFVTGSLVNPGACPDGGDDSFDPLYTSPTADPSVARVDLSLQPTSPGIDAGDPDTYVPQEGGGTRVDIGALEVPIAPVVRLLDPADGGVCFPEGTTDLSFEIEDLQDNIDLASIVVTVLVGPVDGVPVPVGSAFSTSGSGSLITLDVTITGGVGAASQGIVEIVVGDTDSPANITEATFSFTTQPPVVSGVTVG